MSDVDAYTVKEVAERLQLSEATVQRMVARHEIPHMRFGKAIRIPVARYDQWLKERASMMLECADDDGMLVPFAPRLMIPPRS